MTSANKTGNNYQTLLTDYEQTPKAVYAAIAVSFAAFFKEGDLDAVEDHIHREWRILHGQGIVPQAPRRGRA